MIDKRQAIEVALRRQLEAEERSEECRAQATAELYAREPALRKLDESPEGRKHCTKEKIKPWEDMRLRYQMEGFVAGWLVGSGQYQELAELLQIWLDTMMFVSGREPAVPSLGAIADVIGKAATQAAPALPADVVKRASAKRKPPAPRPGP